jgi:hypothetical protein
MPCLALSCEADSCESCREPPRSYWARSSDAERPSSDMGDRERGGRRAEEEERAGTAQEVDQTAADGRRRTEAARGTRTGAAAAKAGKGQADGCKEGQENESTANERLHAGCILPAPLLPLWPAAESGGGRRLRGGLQDCDSLPVSRRATPLLLWLSPLARLAAGVQTSVIVCRMV